MHNTKKGKGTGWVKVGILFMAVIGIVLVFRFTPLSLSSFTPENVRQYILKFGVLSPVVFIIIYTLRAVILVIPVGVMSLAGGLAFGKWWGTLYILIGATGGSCLSFLIARYLGRGVIERLGVFKRGRLKSFDEGVEKNGFRVILSMRLIPLFQYDAVNFGSGLSKMRLRDYALGSFIGMAPGGFINAMLGSSLENIISVQFFIALGLFILLMFIPVIYKVVKRRKESQEKESDDAAKVEQKSRKMIGKPSRGRCPGCGERISMLAVLMSWDRWGRFVCPGCGQWISFRGWLLAVMTMFFAMVGVERLLHLLLISQAPLWLSFTAAFVLALLVMFIIPMVWQFKEFKTE